MKLLKVFFLLIVFSISISAQWVQTNGPEGGFFSDFSYSNDKLYAITSRYNMFTYENETWTRKTNVPYIYNILTVNNNLVATNSNEIFTSTDGGDSWVTNDLSGYITMRKEVEDGVIVAVADTLYKTTNGVDFEPLPLKYDLTTFWFGDTLTEQVSQIKHFLKMGNTYLLDCSTNMVPDTLGIFYSNDMGNTWQVATGLGAAVYINDIMEYDGKVYITTSDSVFVSGDNGMSWNSITNGISIVPGTSGRFDKLFSVFGNLYMYSSWDNYIYRLVSNSWVQDTYLEDASYLYEAEGNVFVRHSTGISKLDFIAQTQHNITEGLVASNVVPYPINETTILASFGRYLYKSTDSGINYEATDYYFKAISGKDDFVFGLNENGVNKSTDMGNTWSVHNSGISSSLTEYTRAVYVNGDDVFVGLYKIRPRTHLSAVWEAGGIYRSTNGGSSWQNVSSGLVSQGGVKVPVRAIYGKGETLFCYTLDGFYRSTNGGSSWSLFENGLTESFTLFDIIPYENGFILHTTQGIYAYSPSQWINVGSQLPTTFNYYYNYSMANVNGNVLAIKKTETGNDLYKYEEGNWVEIESNVPDHIQVTNLKVYNNKVFAAVQDGGIWIADLFNNSSVTLNVNQQAGWNLVSVPVQTDNMNVNSLYPEATGAAFMYNDGYVSVSELETNMGYWLKFESESSVSHTGMVIDKRLPVKAGWNIIGSFGSSASVNNIVSEPEGIITSQFYSFEGGYNTVGTIEPGKGYLVKADADGYIEVAAMPPKTVAAESFTKSLTVTDKNGNRSTLFISENSISEDYYELPPLSPANNFEARFNNKFSSIEATSGGSINVYNADYPVTITANNVSIDIMGSTLKDGESIVFNKSAEAGIEFSVLSMPVSYQLAQNYPNPFNPATKISFSLPEQKEVKLAVFNVLGEKVATLINKQMEAGKHEVKFTANSLPSGVYLYRIEAGDFVQTKKMILMK